MTITPMVQILLVVEIEPLVPLGNLNAYPLRQLRDCAVEVLSISGEALRKMDGTDRNRDPYRTMFVHLVLPGATI